MHGQHGRDFLLSLVIKQDTTDRPHHPPFESDHVSAVQSAHYRPCLHRNRERYHPACYPLLRRNRPGELDCRDGTGCPTANRGHGERLDQRVHDDEVYWKLSLILTHAIKLKVGDAF